MNEKKSRNFFAQPFRCVQKYCFLYNTRRKEREIDKKKKYFVFNLNLVLFVIRRYICFHLSHTLCMLFVLHTHLIGKYEVNIHNLNLYSLLSRYVHCLHFNVFQRMRDFFFGEEFKNKIKFEMIK